MNSDVCQLPAEEERLSSFTRRLIEIAAIAGARGTGTSTINVLNSMHLPVIALDRRGYVVHVNAAADAVFDDDVKMNHKHFFVRDPEARALLKASLDKLTNPVKSKSLIAEPIIVQRRNKLPVILRIWRYDGPTHPPEQQVHALVNAECVGPKSEPARDDPRKDVPSYPSGGEARLRHSTRRASANCCPGTGDSVGDSSYSAEIRLCQDLHPSPKRTCGAASAGRVTDSR
jgi:hypothetical protein